MVGNNLRFGIALLAVLVLPFFGATAFGAEDVFDGTQGTQVLGKELSGSFTTGVAPNTSAVKSKAKLTVLGVAFQALMASVQPPNTIGGTTYAEVYSFGKRIFSQRVSAEQNGLLRFRAGVNPTELRIPAFMYAVGPVLLQIDGGARFQANVQAQVTPEIAFPLEFANFTANLQAVANAAAFIEGYAKLIIIRAGVGGQLDLIAAHGEVDARFAQGQKPLVMVSAMVEFLKGRFYAFFDLFWLSQAGWKRLWDYDLYNWNGYCFATSNLACPAK